MGPGYLAAAFQDGEHTCVVFRGVHIQQNMFGVRDVGIFPERDTPNINPIENAVHAKLLMRESITTGLDRRN